MLNRFGICSSMVKLKHVIHSVSLDQKNAGTRSLLVEKAFTIASTDNVDFLQSYASVYLGDQHHSWHATSIQLVQPMPNTAIHSEQSRTMTRRLFSTAGEATTSESTEGSPSQRAHVPAPPSLVLVKFAHYFHASIWNVAVRSPYLCGPPDLPI